jgi:hypothetical protein
MAGVVSERSRTTASTASETSGKASVLGNTSQDGIGAKKGGEGDASDEHHDGQW